MLLLLLLLGFATPSFGTTYHFEAESALRFNTIISNDTSGYSGTGYVTRFDTEADSLLFQFDADAGLYELIIGYATTQTRKGYELTVNGARSSGMFSYSGPEFMEHRAGKFILNQGTNKITIRKGWGHYHIDYINLIPTTLDSLKKPTTQLTDSQISLASVSLYNFLIANYHTCILSGQQDLHDIKYIKSVTGLEPAVGAFDIIDYSPSRVAYQSDTTGVIDSWIEWAQTGHGIVTVCWHWNAPTDLINKKGKEWFRGFYTIATTFDLEAALADTTSDRYQLLLRDIDAIAVQLKRLEKADIPVLWRPLHEAAGGWFWWGAKGPEPFKKLWVILYDRLVNFHQVHNLIWVFTSDDQHEWYPGDDYVDIIAMDIYTAPSSAMTGEWDLIQRQYNGKKLVALSESGTLPDPDKCRTYGIWWSWFAVWNGSFIREIDKNYLKKVFQDKDIITLNELPDWRKY